MTRVPTALFILAFLSGPVLAQSQRPDFDSLDINGDGVVTIAEFATVYPTKGILLFAAVDQDGDGEVTVDEYALLTPPFSVAGH